MRTTLLAAAFGVLLSGHASAASAPEEIQLPFLADPQIHNVYGASLKQMFPLADWVSKVAIRPPEVNLLAPLVLRDALAQVPTIADSRSDVMIVLGDGTNIGCSGEADVFDREFARSRPDTVRLMAHGNHDSYLMGTVNSYGPWGTNAHAPTPPGDFPVDEAWWMPTGTPEVTSTSGFGRNWLDACYKPAMHGELAGTPMNKPRWLARYLGTLEPHGLQLRSEGMADYAGRRFSAAGRAGTRLAALNYRAAGIWYAPEPATTTRGADYARAWNSFLVQAVDVGPRHTVILIDTSVCQNARGGLAYLWSNAGTHSCMGHAQFETIARLLDQVPEDRRVIFAGHFPLKDLRGRERKRLVRLMERANPDGWTYVSGHTHAAFSDTRYASGIDLNIGSTTDWPMESHALRFDASARLAGRKTHRLSEQVQPLDYAENWNLAGRYSELCRHIGAARALAAATPAIYDTAWISPTMDERECHAIQTDWRASAEALGRDQARISERFDSEKDYREFVLRVAAGASRYEYGQRRFGPRRIP